MSPSSTYPLTNQIQEQSIAKEISFLLLVSREEKRKEMNISCPLSFDGYDLWNAYELSWINEKGKTELAIGSFYFPSSSDMIIESKSFERYLRSFTSLTFPCPFDVKEQLEKDISKKLQADVTVCLALPQDFYQACFKEFPGICLDTLDISIHHHSDQLCPCTKHLKTEERHVEEIVYSNLLRTICPITTQPDWASIQIHYIGPKINHKALLKYLMSFRNYVVFQENCAEKIFADIAKICKVKKLTVYLSYTRKGGIDINSYRSNFEKFIHNYRNYRYDPLNLTDNL